MAATEQEMMERAEAIQTVEELREACAEFGMEMTPEQEDVFMAAKASGGELPTRTGRHRRRRRGPQRLQWPPDRDCVL